MNKTKSHIQAVFVNTDRPKNQGEPIIVRAPLFMKCFRATFVVNNYNSNLASSLWISTAPTNDEGSTLFLNQTQIVQTAVAPANDVIYNAPGTLTLDRRGAGYMVDEFYLYADGCYVTILWEGYIE